MFKRQLDQQTELRELSRDDVEPFYHLVYENREHLGKWMFWVSENFSRSDAAQQIEIAMMQSAANNGFESGIWSRGELTGCIRFNYIDWVHKNTELRYWLGALFQGRGLAIQSCRAFINYAFAELELNRVEIRCMSENLKSRRIPERLGFIKEGVLRQVRWRKDHFDDHVVYGMLSSEWTNKNLIT